MKKLWVIRAIKFGLNEPIQNLQAKTYHSKISGRAGFSALKKFRKKLLGLSKSDHTRQKHNDTDKRINVIVLACIH